MGKLPHHRALKDVTIRQNNSKRASSGSLDLFSNLTSAKGKVEIHDNKSSTKKRKFNKIEEDPTETEFKNTGYVNFEPSFNKKLPKHKLDSSLSLSCSSIKKETIKQEDASSPFPHQLHHASSSSVSGLVYGSNLIVMSCLNCYLHVMVSDANPKCPKCARGDCLLDIYRGV